MEKVIIIANIIGLGLIIYWWYSRKNNKDENPKNKIGKLPKKSIGSELKLENVDVGGVISLKFIGEQLHNYNLIIVKKNCCRDSEASWFELVGETADHLVTLEYEEDDPTDVYVFLEEIPLRELGVSMERIYEIEDNERGSFTYKGNAFFFDDSDEAAFFPNSDEEKGRPFYYWDFLSDDNKQAITIEKWEDSPTKAKLYEHVPPDHVEIYSLRES